MTDSLLFTQDDIEWIDSLRGYLIDDDWQFAVGLRLRLQQWIDQQAEEDAFDATITRSVEDGSFHRAFGHVIDETDLTEG